MRKQENLRLKKVRDQVLVITGATSGIGLATALMAGKRGAKVVLASRNKQDLQTAVQEIKQKGGQAIGIETDVSNFDDVRNLRNQAVARFGRIDTWVNNAAGSVYGPTLSTPIDEAKQLMETNFWGIHYGCVVAVEAMRTSGGMIINLGSEVSERAVAPQTFYSASKHAIKGYTEGLRTEIEKEGLPIGFTLVRPAAIDTPFTEHAVNHLEDGEPSLPAPVYHPDIAANAILECSETGKRDVYVGGASKLFSVLNHLLPRALDYGIEAFVADQNKLGSKIPHTKENEGLMKAPMKEGRVRGGHKGHVAKTSLWTTLSLHPALGTLAVGSIALLGISLLRKDSVTLGRPGAKILDEPAVTPPVETPETSTSVLH